VATHRSKWESLFEFEAIGKTLEELETPVPVIDFDVMMSNLERWQAHCDAVGIANYPHIKTHKLVPVAKLQLALGAKGICVQKLGEAEVMADAGITEMLLTFNIIGSTKLARLEALCRKTKIAVVADSIGMLDGLSHAAQSSGRKLQVLVECDTGAGRNGVQTPEEALALATHIDKTPHLSFGGLMTYPPAFARGKINDFLVHTKELLKAAGLDCPRITTGGSKDMWDPAGLEHISEYRAGTYIYFDRSLVSVGACTFGDCAETVLATVVSTPTPDRAIIDAGSKALTSDLLGLEGYGVVQGLEMAQVYNVNEEHGYLDTSHVKNKPRVGDQLRITMNHVCPVNNLFDKVVFARGNEVLGALRVDARGKVQ
jgi:D-serine deaminase-like pyridoxal phosphate-dependent protein